MTANDKTLRAPCYSLIVTPIDDDGGGLRRDDVDRSRWNTRGLTMQERSLSTRTVHFCTNKLYFECRGSLKSEENEPERTQASDPFQLWPRPLDGEGVASDDPRKWYEHWRRAVVGYSRRRLTVSSDKLTAIRSLANEMAAHVPPGDYLPEAAVWRSNIRKELLWYVESGIARRPSVKRAPSWSWASLDAHVGYIIGRRSGYCQLADLDVLQVDGTGICKVSGHRMLITRIQQVDDHERDRASFPYGIVGSDGRPFARGILDLNNRDSLLSSGNSFCYLHISNDQQPSGLILTSRLAVDNINGWGRVGVATVFQISGEMINPALLEPGESPVVSMDIY